MNFPEKIIIGLMSGTSLDGLDIAACSFKSVQEKFEYTVLAAETIEYNPGLRNTLRDLMKASAEEFSREHFNFGYFLGEKVKEFCVKHFIKPDWISSHGHTIFHQPENGFTVQIGHGAAISAKAGLPVIFDFRALDVALGGQGAPLVPIGDKLLYSNYSHCLNLGGIANISFDDKSGKRVAFDICPVNMILNFLANQKDQEYDNNGQLAASGSFSEALFEKLNSLEFFNTTGPKSLGKEWVDQKVIPLIQDSELCIEDKLHTFCRHIAFQIARTIDRKDARILATGGGALNTFLITKLEKELIGKAVITVPEPQTVLFKEAIIFAFLGYLRIFKQANCLASVTGAENDNIGGLIVG